jgi:5'-3' exonuclease
MESLKKKMNGSAARFALIDADSILYAVALSSELISKGSGEGGEDEHFQVKDGQECYREVVSRLESLVQEVGAEDALICLTPPGKCFRYLLLPSYKANRANVRRPDILLALQAMVAERRPFRTLAVRGLEADDICGASQGMLQKAGLREPIIVSIDKDMLQIPGLNYSWMAAARNGTVGQLNEITEEAGDRMHFYQTLVGDVVDNYTGVPGIGPKKADKLLNECMDTQGVLDWAWIVEAFRKKGLPESYALTQARVARILRSTDWDPKHKEVKLWTPSEFSKSNLAAKPMPSVIAGGAKGTSRTSLETPLIASTAGPVPTKIILDERKGATLH